jgi:hypothetical protein
LLGIDAREILHELDGRHGLHLLSAGQAFGRWSSVVSSTYIIIIHF